MAAPVCYICTICKTLTNSISELHNHQTRRHTRGELSWSMIILRELVDVQNAIAAPILPVEFPLDRNHPMHFQNYGNFRQLDVPQNAHDDKPLRINNGINIPWCHNAPLHQQTNGLLLKNKSFPKPVDKYSNQIPQKQCEPVHFPIYHSAISSYKPTSLEVEFSQVPQISDQSFLKSVQGICDDLSANERTVKKTNLMYARNKTSSVIEKNKQDAEQSRCSMSSNSYGKKYMHGKNSNVNCQKIKVNKKPSQLIANNHNIHYENKQHVSLKDATNVLSVCKENCMQQKSKPHCSLTEKSQISSERRITIQSNVLKESNQLWPDLEGSGWHSHNTPASSTYIQQGDEKKISVQPVFQGNNMPSIPNMRNNPMVNVSKDQESTFLSFLNPWTNFVTFNKNKAKNKQRADVFSERKTNTTL